ATNGPVAPATRNEPLRIAPPPNFVPPKLPAVKPAFPAGSSSAELTPSPPKQAAKPVPAPAKMPPPDQALQAKPPVTKAPAAKAPVGKVSVTQREAPLDLPPPPLRGGKDFLWPTEGRVGVNYGDRVNGISSSGIRILTRRGSQVVASENGTVVYADFDTRSLGKQVIIRHAEGYMTVYAYLDSFKVRRGSIVHRGQVIGTTGQSVDAKKPELYFSIHKDNDPVNPMRLLAKP
ncbi:MAG: peptidoglycan DD-metalloendopeptidase family protein, partial [Alphaproteobacteria bacterium]|nr:peptidoglycan DD-metalloendopeptidase family protein [Alphaproteobacteria bacterium]